MKTTQQPQPNSSIVFATGACKSRLTAKILPAFLVALFAFLSAAPSNAATSAKPLVAASGGHSLFVKSDGTLWAMGYNYFGQLGVGDYDDRHTPTQVKLPANSSGIVIAVAAGNDCSLFVTSDGKLWYMGYGPFGPNSVILGTPLMSNIPVQVTTSGSVIAVAAGYNYSMYVTSDGRLWAIGENDYGQFGTGATSTVPVTTATNIATNVATNVTTPVAISLSAYWQHSLYVASNGTLWAAGSNMDGVLGNGTSNDSYTFVPVSVNSATKIDAVATGMSHCLYVTSDGQLWAMGGNWVGEFGNGDSSTISNIPVQVTTPGSVIAVATGNTGSFDITGYSLYVTNDGILWAMGDNEAGQLGVGPIADNRDVFTPTPVPSATNVIAVATGGQHTLYVTSNGDLYAMGANANGQLGNGATTGQSTPVRVATGLATLAAPVITTPPASQTVKAGQSVTFTVVATGTYLSYQWYKNGSPITGATGASYTTNTQPSDNAATYTVTVTNPDGSASTSSTPATLTVNAPPTFTTQPTNQTVSVGGTATFTAVTSGNPAPSYKWQSAPKGSSAWADITLNTTATTTTLTLPDVTADMNGNQYHCLATNLVSTATSAAATLTLVPTVTSISPTTVKAGDTITIVGTNLTGVTDITIGGASATVVSNDGTTLEVIVPATAANGTMQLFTSTGMLATQTLAITPTVTSVSLTTAKSGDIVTITGANLTGATATIGGATATVSASTVTTFRVTVPASATDGTIVVTTAGGSTTAEQTLTITPTITGASPTTAKAGDTLTITGANLANATSVTIGGATAAITSNDATTLKVTIPATATSNTIVVTTAGGSATTSIGGITPTVTSISPTTVKAGDTITIAGTNLLGVTVTIGTVTVAVVSNDGTTLKVTVPDSVPSSTFGTVAVKTAAGATIATQIITITPTVTDVSPDTAKFGDTITITGANLISGSVTGATVTIGGATATIVSNTYTTLKVTVPANTADGTIVVTTAGCSTTATQNLTITPTVTSVSPATVKSGDTITIAGTNLAGATVTIGSVTANIVSNDGATLKVTVPASATTGTIVVTTAGGAFTPTQTLSIVDSVSPDTAKSGDTITITGANLTGATVTIGGVTATIISNDGATLKVAVPAGATTGTIVVKTTAGSVTAAQPIAITPTVTSFSPATAKAGDTITITGANLTGATVTIGGATATVTSTTVTTLKVTVPANTTDGTIVVKTAGGSVTATQTLTITPTVTSVSPMTAKSGDTITIKGTNLFGATVTIGGVPATDVVVSTDGTTLTFTVPPNATSGTIVVTTAGGSFTPTQILTFTPTVTSISPVSPDTVKADDTITIAGTNLAGVTVTIGGVTATPVSNDATTLKVTVPATATSGTIIVKTAAGTTIATQTVTITPTVTSFSPATAKAGDTITITGANLTGATVTIGGATATVTSTTVTTLKVTVPASATSGSIVVTTAGGNVTAAQILTITPTVTNVTPTTAKAGDTITITGTNLTGAKVFIGGVEATIVSNDGTTLKVTVPQNATSGTIVVTTAGGSFTASQNLIITQPPPPVTPVLTVDKFTLSLKQPATTTDTFDITSNIAWAAQVKPAANWLVVNPASGSGNANATATTLSANTTGAPRYASIVVSGSSNGINISRYIYATQDAVNAAPNPAAAAPLPVGAKFTLTVTNTTAPGNPQTTRTYTVTTGTTLTTTDTTGPLTLAYEYNATGATGTLIIPDLDSVYSLTFTNATTGTLTLYTFDADGPYDLPGTFTYTPPAAPTYTLNVTNGTGSGAYAANATVSITANAAPSSSQVFDHWTTSNGGAFANANNATTTFTMPANATTITAIYSTPPTPPNPHSGGGGGGGAPSLLYLAAAAALLALRGKRR